MDSAKKILISSTRHLKESIGKERTAQLHKAIESISESRCIYLMVDEVFAEFDNNHISKEEFINYVENNPKILYVLHELADFEIMVKPVKPSKSN